MKIVICIPSLNGHYVDSGISYIAIYDTNNQTYEDYPINLVDFNKLPLPNLDSDVFLVYNKRLFDKFYPNNISYDLETEFWINNLSLDKSLLDFKKFYYFYRRSDYYRFIPYPILKDSCQKFLEDVSKILVKLVPTKASDFYRTIVYPTIEMIESNGMQIDLEKFNNNFNKKYVTNIVRSYYNIHTSTGRPSNTFDNVNYLALSKKDETRNSFISRFKNGYLVEYDFDSYHLRLIGKMVGVDFSKVDSVHTALAKEYFNKEDISEEDYLNSKKLSFLMLYKDSDELIKSYDFEFFNKVNTLKSSILKEYEENGYLESKISGRKLVLDTNYDKSKLFNYFIQMMETEFSMLFIYDISKILKDKLSKIILYTYDSILIDFNPLDGENTLRAIENNLLKTKISKGTNYKDMMRISLS